jgi:hypothetical protein
MFIGKLIRRRLPAWRFHCRAALSPPEEPRRQRHRITPQARMLFYHCRTRIGYVVDHACCE